MSILSMGEKMKSIYIERFAPLVGVPVYIAVLDTSRVIAIESHWVESDDQGKRGMYECINTSCCLCLGNKRQTYNLPILVYNNETSPDGILQNWTLSTRQYKELVGYIESGWDLLQSDLCIRAEKQGRGTRQTMIPQQGATRRSNMTQEQLNTLKADVEHYYTTESSMVRKMSPAEWEDLLRDQGYDLQTGQQLNNYSGGYGNQIPTQPHPQYIPPVTHEPVYVAPQQPQQPQIAQQPQQPQQPVQNVEANIYEPTNRIQVGIPPTQLQNGNFQNVAQGNNNTLPDNAFENAINSVKNG